MRRIKESNAHWALMLILTISKDRPDTQFQRLAGGPCTSLLAYAFSSVTNLEHLRSQEIHKQADLLQIDVWSVTHLRRSAKWSCYHLDLDSIHASTEPNVIHGLIRIGMIRNWRQGVQALATCSDEDLSLPIACGA